MATGAKVGSVLEDYVGPEGSEAPCAGGVEGEVEEGAVDVGIEKGVEVR
jgi:hypothetical protein